MCVTPTIYKTDRRRRRVTLPFRKGDAARRRYNNVAMVAAAVERLKVDNERARSIK